MGIFEKILFPGLTALISYQAIYNLIGDYELGELYLTWHSLGYSIGTLIPAILLGVHACKIAYSSSMDSKIEMANKLTYKLIAALYYGIVAYMICFRIYIHVQWDCQLAKEHIVSYERSRTWLIYYWGVLQYGLSIALTVAYTIQVKDLKGKKASEKIICPTKTASSPTILPATNYEQPVYMATSLV